MENKLSVLADPNDIIRHFVDTGKAIKWPIEAELSDDENPAIKYRNTYARKMAQGNINDILASYIGMTAEEMDELVHIAQEYALQRPLEGVGLELGAGCGLLAATLCKASEVESVFGIELCAEMTTLIIPRISASVLGEERKKVVPVVGSFDTLAVEDCSIDFIVEIGSLHHSDDLYRTLKEVHRVLKPGGQLLCFDRCQPDSMKDEEIEARLNVRYSKNFLIKHGYPPDIILTRRENGEHEYRFNEWQDAFNRSGLRLEKCVQLLNVDYRRAIRGLLSVFPRKLKKYLYNTDDATLSTAWFWLLNKLNKKPDRDKWWEKIPAPKNETLFYLTKPA